MTTTVHSLMDTLPAVEPLPLYTRRAAPDPDSVSILSSAPSYRSEAPPYTPSIEPLAHVVSAPASSSQQQTGIPSQRYAPGFTPRPGGPVGNVANHSYNVASWSSVTTSGAVRQYENVARRRVERDNVFAGLLNTTPPPSTNPSGIDAAAGANASAGSSNAVTPAAVELLASPLEDPALVGEAAAKAAKDARLNREHCSRGDSALKDENRSWDFMLGQMADWEERERSWNKFRDEVARGTRVKLAKRIGAMQRR